MPATQVWQPDSAVNARAAPARTTPGQRLLFMARVAARRWPGQATLPWIVCPYVKCKRPTSRPSGRFPIPPTRVIGYSGGTSAFPLTGSSQPVEFVSARQGAEFTGFAEGIGQDSTLRARRGAPHGTVAVIACPV